MPTIQQLLEEKTAQAIATVSGIAAPAIVTPTTNPRFGDYQANGVMAVAKAQKQNPRKLAEAVIAELKPDDIPATWDIAGPGFINFHLDPHWLGQTMLSSAHDERLGVEPAAHPVAIVVDFSAPNVAKSIHVGHIRSTILGDTLTRILRFLGQSVTTDNHLGDWGTQFGMLVVGYRSFLDQAAYERDPLSEMERMYKEVQAKIKTDTTLADSARQELAKLQQGDADNTALWNEFMQV